jgi:YtcA family
MTRGVVTTALPWRSCTTSRACSSAGVFGHRTSRESRNPGSPELQTVDSRASLLGQLDARRESSTQHFTNWRPMHRGSHINRPTRLVSSTLFLGQALSSAGCGGAPSLTIAGAYFPAWLLCDVIAVLVAAFIRAVMVSTCLANFIPYQLAVCCSTGVIVALVLGHFWLGH